MDYNFTDFTKNDTFMTWTSSGDISSSTDRVPPAPARPARRAPRHNKRPSHYDSYYGEPPAKRAAPSIRVGAGFKWNLQTLAAAADAVESGGKSPVSALNELGVRVAYSVLRQGGPAHCPSFHVAVTVADMRFEGWGHSKREARASAARACLAALLARAGRVLPAPSPHQDFTSDEPHRFPVSEFQCLEPRVTAAPAPADTELTNGKEVSPGGGADSESPVSSLFGAASPAAHKSPINVLYENYSGLAFTCTFGDGSPLTETQAPLQLSHSMRFKVVCLIKEHKFEGYGSSKKLAKLAAARSALAALEEGRSGREDCAPAATPQGALHQTLADHIGKLVNEKFNELMKNDLVHSKRKVLAGIVITTHNRIEDARVIAVTTGTKCVSGEHMSVTGRAVNDCHAEVAARRCLQRHLYAQLLMYANQPDPSQPLEESDLEPLPGGGYQLKASRAVHLYVSTAPCGDGRIFSPHEHHHAEPDKHPNRLARGQLRTKIESGEGTIPVKNCNNVLQTWDGVMQGERLLTMSCSDKVARWCVCGLQGALLSRLIRPVYLTSLVLGSLLHPHHMYRAICGRIEAYISSLPPPFHLQRPLLSRAASTEARTPARAPSFSVCWCSTQPLPEVINATTGKLESGQPSLLCKQSMFARWHYLVRRLPLLPQDAELDAETPELPDKPDALLYNEAKQMCPTYQLAKQRLIEAFEKAKLGRWIKRPLEQDQFVCEITDASPSLLFAWVSPSPPRGAARLPPATTPTCVTPTCVTPTCVTPTCVTPTCVTPTCVTPTFATPTCVTPTCVTPTFATPTCACATRTDSHQASRLSSTENSKDQLDATDTNCHSLGNSTRNSTSSRKVFLDSNTLRVEVECASIGTKNMVSCTELGKDQFDAKDTNCHSLDRICSSKVLLGSNKVLRDVEDASISTNDRTSNTEHSNKQLDGKDASRRSVDSKFCNNAQAIVKSPLLLKRLYMYERFGTKYK